MQNTLAHKAQSVLQKNLIANEAKMTLFFLIVAPVLFGAGLALPLYLYTTQRERAYWRRYISRREPTAGKI